jgi:phage-related protein
MAGGSRTLKLSILGDVDNLNKSLKTASGDVDSFGDKVGKAGAKIGAAFAAAAAAAGAAAIAIGVEAVKAAIEDEKAQTQLALALENATGATDAQIKATEASILQMSLATGVADDQLRPALARLVRSTGDTSKAQELLATALDVAAATGKPVEAVANSLAKAYDGNTTALGKLGVGLSAAELKTMSFDQVQTKLSELFGGAAAANAETYAGKIARVQIAFDEAKETLGTALLPILDKFLQFINQNALPAIQAFTNAFSLTGTDGFGKTISEVGAVIKQTVQPIFEGIKSVFDRVKTAIKNNKDEFQSFAEVIAFVAPILGKVIGTAFENAGKIASIAINIIGKVMSAIKPLLNMYIEGINLIIRGINLVKPGADIAFIPKIGETSVATPGASGFSGTMPGGGSFTTGGETAGTGGGGAGNKITTSTFAGGTGGVTGGGVTTASKAAVTAQAAITGLGASGVSGVSTTSLAGILAASGGNRGSMTSAGTTINLTVNGALDKEGTARTIVDTLNNSFYRGTGGAGNLVTA